ncbi:50S ribosomal protein L11 methyltransferase [Desulfovibrio sp. OttesenSCG-928-G15]|nr:50S ribosomal protein L11 methyltransferase [Desulfovibrio sp. OttesenSCG-928-G15]
MATLTKLVITLPPDFSPEEADILDGLLTLHVSHGWEEEALPTGELVCLVHFTVPDCARELADALAATLPRAKVAASQEEEQNWTAAWKEFFTPVEGGQHFLVLAPWMRDELAATTRIPLIIEPKTAFGTGHHATTALCLDVLSRLYAEGSLQQNMRFLDLGTGSGILGLGLAKLGLTGEGLDIDPPAIDNSLENREINRVAQEAFAVRLGSVDDASGPYDVIVANILAGPLKDMAPKIAAIPGPAGKRPLLVLSGLLDVQTDRVIAAYTALGYPQPHREARGEWVALAFC